MIRTSTEINVILNKAQQALAQLGVQISEAANAGVENIDPDQRDRIIRLETIRAILQTILTSDGAIVAYFSAPANAKKFNNILDGLAALSKQYSGPFIPMLGTRNIPIAFYGSGGSGGGGSGGPVTPGGTTFQNLSVNSPGEVVDTFNANISSFAYYMYSVQGVNIGEGNRSGFFILSWKGTDVTISGDVSTSEVGGNTDNVFFSAAIVSGQVQLTCNVPSNNWTVRGTRILFQNISFSSAQGDFPNGIRTDTSGPFWVDRRYEITWDMVSLSSRTLDFPLTYLNSHCLGIVIHPSPPLQDNALNLDYVDGANINTMSPEGGWQVIADSITMYRKPSGGFDSATYNNATAVITMRHYIE